MRNSAPSKSVALPQSPFGYGWKPVPANQQDRPILLFDLDGTLRGDVAPMVRLTRPLIPNITHKVTLQEPLNTGKLIRFLWNLASLWTLRTIHRQQRRRYKHLFSELHNLAAALLHDVCIEEVRLKYRDALPGMPNLWSKGDSLLLITST